MNRHSAILICVALASGYAAAATVTPGSNGTQGPEGAAQRDYSTHKVYCSQSPGISVQLPTQGAPVSWPACSTVQIMSSDICTNTAGGCPILDTNSRLPVAQMPPITVVTPTGMACAGKTDTTTSTSTTTGTGTFYQTSAQPVTCTVTKATTDIGIGMESPRTIYYFNHAIDTIWGLSANGSETTSSYAQSVTSTSSLIMHALTDPNLVQYPSGAYKVILWAGMASAPASLYYTIRAGAALIATSPTITVGTGAMSPYSIVATAASSYSTATPSSTFLYVEVYASSASTNNMTIGYGGSNASHVSTPWMGYTASIPVANGTADPGSTRIPAMMNHVHPLEGSESCGAHTTPRSRADGTIDPCFIPSLTSTSSGTGTFTGSNNVVPKAQTYTRTSTATSTATYTETATSLTNSTIVDNGNVSVGGTPGTDRFSVGPGNWHVGDSGYMTSPQRICGHAFAGGDIACSASDVGALAPNGLSCSGTNTFSASNGQVVSCSTTTYLTPAAVSGTTGFVPYFSSANTLGNLAPYATSLAATAVPITDGSGTLNSFITGATGSGNSVTVNGGRVTSISSTSYLTPNGQSCSGANTINATNGQITGCATYTYCQQGGTNCPSAATLGAVPLSEWRIKGAALGAATTDISVNTASGWTLAVASSSFTTGAYTDVYATTVFNGSCTLGGTWVSICMAVNVDSSAMIGGQGCTTVYAHGASFSLVTTGRWTPGAGAHNVNAFMKIGAYSGTSTGTGCSIGASAPLTTVQNATTQVFLRENG